MLQPAINRSQAAKLGVKRCKGVECSGCIAVRGEANQQNGGSEGHDPKTPCLANLFSLMHDMKIVVGLEEQELTILGKPILMLLVQP